MFLKDFGRFFGRLHNSLPSSDLLDKTHVAFINVTLSEITASAGPLG